MIFTTAGDDIIINEKWECLLEGLNLKIENDQIKIHDMKSIKERLEGITEATNIVEIEEERLTVLEAEKRAARIKAETSARQKGEGIAATEQAGQEAADSIEDPGPKDGDALLNAQILLDENDVENSLWIIRKISQLQWKDSAPCRIGCRMGRPEKSAPREMKQKAHALYPIQNYGGPQRLLATAVSREGSIRVTVGPRRCLRCERETPHVRCHHRTIKDDPRKCI